MKYCKEGSLTVLMVGLFWLTGIMAVVLYAMVAHLSTLVETRELQMRYFYLLEGGMQTALAHMKGNTDLYVPQQSDMLLYEGPWSIDPRHPNLGLRISYSVGPEEAHGQLDGSLYTSNARLLRIIWYVRYHDTDTQWHRAWGEQRFD